MSSAALSTADEKLIRDALYERRRLKREAAELSDAKLARKLTELDALADTYRRLECR